MREDNEKMKENNEIQKENNMLQEQYDALTKEISEKQLLMETQLTEKEKTSSTIEEEMSGKILS